MTRFTKAITYLAAAAAFMTLVFVVVQSMSLLANA